MASRKRSVKTVSAKTGSIGPAVPSARTGGVSGTVPTAMTGGNPSMPSANIGGNPGQVAANMPASNPQMAAAGPTAQPQMVASSPAAMPQMTANAPVPNNINNQTAVANQQQPRKKAVVKSAKAKAPMVASNEASQPSENAQFQEAEQKQQPTFNFFFAGKTPF